MPARWKGMKVQPSGAGISISASAARLAASAVSRADLLMVSAHRVTFHSPSYLLTA